MKTVCYLETDSDGNPEWWEGCVCVDRSVFEHSIELVDKKEAEAYIKKLEDRLNVLSWQVNPERMGQ